MPSVIGERAHGWRSLAQAFVIALGLVAIAGSGGGYSIDCLFCNPVVEPPGPRIDLWVSVPPAVQVGEPAEISVGVTANSTVTLPLSYQWCRAEDSASPCVDISGANAPAYTLASANLGDDGAVFAVTVRGGNTAASAQATLHVSNTPPVVFEYGDFATGHWVVTAVAGGNLPPPAHQELRETAGGHPDAYLRIVQSTSVADSVYKVFYLSPTAVYDPSVQGALYAVDFALDAVSLDPPPPYRPMRRVLPLIEQGGRRFVGGWTDIYPIDAIGADWITVTTYRLVARGPFQLADGTDCGEPGYGCIPDFSASAPLLRFGFAFDVSAPEPGTLNWGIDNWRVMLWRR